jgi:hypothetical protein
VIIPREELKKFNALNKLLEEFYGLKEKIQFRGIYADKLQLLLQNSTRKSVGCEAKFRLNPELKDDGTLSNSHPRWGGDGTNWVLTREGIKEEFGYTGDFKCRKPTGSIWWDRYVKNKVVTANLIKCIGEKDLRCEAALREHIQLRRDLLKLSIEDGEYFKKIELPVAMIVQGAVEGDYGDEDEDIKVPKFSTCNLVFKLGGGWNDSDIAMVQGEVVWKKKSTYQDAEWQYDKHDSLSNKCSFVQYLRYSEPDTYNVLVNHIKYQIAEVKEYIAKQTAQVEAVIAKYGHYLVFAEL